MNTKHKNRAVIRDPGTVYLSWDTKLQEEQEDSDTLEWTLKVSDLSSGAEESIKINPNSGNYYLHDLQPDTYYKIAIYFGEHSVLDFAAVHTLKNSISSQADINEEWRTDKESLLRLTGGLWDAFGSSNGIVHD